MTEADRALCERVCRKLGIEPRREWVVGTPPDANGKGGSISMTFTPELGFPFNDKAVATMWLELKRKGMKGPSLYDEWEPWEQVIYPDILDWPGMGLVVEKLQALGIRTIRSDFSPIDHSGQVLVTLAAKDWSIAFPDRLWYEGAADTLPRALAMAADALEVPGE